MNTTNLNFYKSVKKYTFSLLFLLASVTSMAQQPIAQDTTQTGFGLGNLKFPNPESIVSKYTYDPITDRYYYTESVGNFNINYPVILTPDEYEQLVIEENLKSYYKQKIDAFDGKKDGTEEEQKNLLPEFYVDSDFFETVFGGNTIEVVDRKSVV